VESKKYWVVVVLLSSFLTVLLVVRSLNTKASKHPQRKPKYQLLIPENSLIDLKDVCLIVDCSAGEDEKKHGLTEEVTEQLQAQVESFFHQKGLAIFQDFRPGYFGYPLLELTINAMLDEKSERAMISGTIKLQQRIILERLDAYCHATTWSYDIRMNCSSNHLVYFAQYLAIELAEEFINNYLAANPRKSKSPP
jgi:hypothetical protein